MLRRCPPIVALRVDAAPVVGPLRGLVWAQPYDGREMPDVRTSIRAAAGDRASVTTSLDALEAFLRQHDDAARKLRVHLRQHWSDTIDLVGARRYIDAMDLWRPFLDIRAFSPNHPLWAVEFATRCMIHGVKSLLFLASGQLSASQFRTYIPLAYALLRD